MFFLTNVSVALCHAPPPKFKLLWFPEESGYSAEKGYKDINLSPPMSNEDKNISGSLVLDLRK